MQKLDRMSAPLLVAEYRAATEEWYRKAVEERLRALGRWLLTVPEETLRTMPLPQLMEEYHRLAQQDSFDAVMLRLELSRRGVKPN